MSEWQPIETAPKDGTIVELWYDHIRWREVGMWRENPEIRNSGGWFFQKPEWLPGLGWLPRAEWPWYTHGPQPTHWRPVVEPQDVEPRR